MLIASQSVTQVAKLRTVCVAETASYESNALCEHEMMSWLKRTHTHTHTHTS
jgi:hypothetical protein